jgi:hypothetical protein
MPQNLKRWVIIAQSGDTLDESGREIQEEVLYWNNETGWTTEIAEAFIVYDDEKAHCTLPIGGMWLDITKETS